MKRILLLSLVAMFVFTASWAQRSVTGSVTGEEDGTPIPGVNVIVKGTSVGTVTDIDGLYQINIPEGGEILVFSFIGLATEEVEIGTQSVIDMVMTADIKQLTEIVVSGVAGATTPKKLTVSVTKIGVDRLNAVTGYSLANSLSGKVAGVRSSNANGSPGGQTDILLRADNNLNNVNSSPLIMIDGQIVTGGLSDINADDVESMEVIKGAAASALYGSRAGNGVIYITTKRGSNLSKNEVRVNVRNEVGVQEIAKYLELADHHVYSLASDWESYRGQYTKFDGVTYPDGYIGGGWHPDIAGNRTIDSDHYMDNQYGKVTNQQEKFFQQGVNYTNYVSLQSRSEKSNLFASFENNSQSGIIMNTDGFQRQNYRINYDLDITKWLRFSTSNLFVNTKTNYPGSGGGIFFNIVLAEPDANFEQPNPDGQPYYLRMNHFNGETVNPLYPLWKAQRDNKTKRFLSNYKLNINITDWVNLDLTHSIETENYHYTLYNPKDTWTPTGGTDETFGMSYTDGSLEKYSRETVSNNTQATLNLGGAIGDLSIKGKLSYLYEDRQREWFDVNSTQFAVKDIPTFDNFTTINDAYSGQEIERAQNYFAILGLDWRDKLLFDGMYRYDGSSLFGPDARWNPYFRVSGAYRISQDVKIPGIDELKIRAAYGTAGIRPGYSWQYETYNLSKGVTSPSQKGNTELKPSKTAETEFGLNIDFLERFTFEAVYAQSKTTDQFLNVDLIPFLNDGFNKQYQNAGTVESKTFEATLGANWIKNSEFKWNTNVVFSRIRTKITELPIPAYVYGDTDGGAQAIFYIREGETYGAMYGHTWVRSLEQMEAQLADGETIADYELNSDGYVVPAGSIGTPDEKAIKVLDEQGNPFYTKIGDGNPDFNMGISNTFAYKGLSLYLLLDMKSGGDVYNSKGQWITRDLRNGIMDMSGVNEGDKKAYDYWVNFYDTNIPNAYWVEDASFVKVRELALGYSIPSAVLNGFANGAFRGVTLKLIGRNLLTFSNYSGYDPEVGTVRQPYDGTYKYPNFRNYAVSLSLDF